MWLRSSLSSDDDELGESCILWLYSWSQLLLMLHCPGGDLIKRCVICGAMGNGRDIGAIDFVHQWQGHLVAQRALVGSHPQRHHRQAHNHVRHMSGACGRPQIEGGVWRERLINVAVRNDSKVLGGIRGHVVVLASMQLWMPPMPVLRHCPSHHHRSNETTRGRRSERMTRERECGAMRG